MWHVWGGIIWGRERMVPGTMVIRKQFPVGVPPEIMLSRFAVT